TSTAAEGVDVTTVDNAGGSQPRSSRRASAPAPRVAKSDSPMWTWASVSGGNRVASIRPTGSTGSSGPVATTTIRSSSRETTASSTQPSPVQARVTRAYVVIGHLPPAPMLDPHLQPAAHAVPPRRGRRRPTPDGRGAQVAAVPGGEGGEVGRGRRRLS